MLYTRLPLPVKFFCAFIYVDKDIYGKTENILEKKFGKIDFQSQKIDFNCTDYYSQEMGKTLFRKFVSFKRLRKPSDFINIKLFCIKLENKFAKNKRRRINIDPGYINDAKLVLTTTKDFAHRIYLNKGVFAEVTLSFADGKFNYFPTTFSDYKTPQYINIFMSIRKKYHKQIEDLSFKF